MNKEQWAEHKKTMGRVNKETGARNNCACHGTGKLLRPIAGTDPVEYERDAKCGCRDGRIRNKNNKMNAAEAVYNFYNRRKFAAEDKAAK
jgi:hypothetical protein